MKTRDFILFATVFFLCSEVVLSQQRKVLVEQFTNSGCPPCASNTPVIASYVNANPSSVLMLAYHTSFPYLDSMYHENPMQSNQRVAYYNVTGVPTSRVDGNYFSGNLVPTLNTTIMNRSADAPRYNITFSSVTFNNGVLNSSATFESTNMANQNEPLVAHIVVAEKNVLKSSYVCCAGANSETEYPWVVRRMLPDVGGTPLINTALGLFDFVSVTWTANNIKNISEMRVIAFVQNSVTKEVYQSEITVPALNTGVEVAAGMKNKLFSVSNPVRNNKVEILFHQPALQKKIVMLDLLGNIIYENLIQPDSNHSIDVKNFYSGIYFISLESEGQKQINKIIIP